MSDIQIKICGLRDEAAIDAAAEAGATHIGLVHYEPSPRHVTIEQAANLRMRAPSSLQVVLVTVELEPKELALAIEAVRPDVVQLHGREAPQWAKAIGEHAPCRVWKSFALRNSSSLEKVGIYDDAADMILFDTPAKALPGGNGVAFDWSLLDGWQGALPYGLAGGLNPDNVAQAIRDTDAVLVDTSSGVESAPGVKDPEKISAFCAAAKSV